MGLASSKLVLGIDLGGTKIAGAVVREGGRFVAESDERTPPGDSRAVLAALDGLIARLISKVDEPISGLGLGVAGTVDFARGAVVFSPNLPFRDEPLRTWAENKFSLPCFVDNDGNLAALGEMRFGAARGASHAVGLTLGTGIGAGIIIGGDLYRGATGGAGEIGHMILDAEGPACTCGSRGCFEALAAGPALARRAHEALSGGKDSMLLELFREGLLTGEAVTEAARAGDAVSKGAVAATAYWIGVGLTNIVNVFNPEVITIGGGMADAGDLLLAPAKRTMASLAMKPNSEIVRIVLSELGNRAGILGAASLALDAPA